MTEIQQESPENEIILDKTQLKAIDACCDTKRRIVAITGAAGTGKTTILQHVYKSLSRQSLSVVLCSPTGKAAKRITEVTGIEARTFHRLLEYPYPGEIDKETGKALRSSDPKRDRAHPLAYKVVLADEYAMSNVEIHRNLLAALPFGGVIRMFGDANQLQPIETAKRLQIADSSFLQMLDRFEGIRLETIHRQADGSNIISNGQRIILGNVPRRTEDFVLKITNHPVQMVLDFVLDNLEDEIDFGSISNQLITPTKVGWVGTEALNSSIQLMLQPENKPYQHVSRHEWSNVTDQRFYLDDKVIVTKNNYNLEVFNGETGLIIDLNADSSITVDFGDKIVNIPNELEMEGKAGSYIMNPQKDLDLAYVITTHKSQGSEYDRVCYIMNKSRPFLLNRKNFYTAISRAREHVTVITDAKALDLSLTKKGDKG